MAPDRHADVYCEREVDGRLAGQRLVVAIDSWNRGSKHPVGHLVKALGPVGEIGVETEVCTAHHSQIHRNVIVSSSLAPLRGWMQALLVEADLASTDFTSNVLAELAEYAGGDEGWSIPAEELEQRRDIRDRLVSLGCSIHTCFKR